MAHRTFGAAPQSAIPDDRASLPLREFIKRNNTGVPTKAAAEKAARGVCASFVLD